MPKPSKGRKAKFRYHGKCRTCGGPITDWKERIEEAFDTCAINMSIVRKGHTPQQVFQWMDSIYSQYCPGECRTIADAVIRLRGDRQFPYIETTTKRRIRQASKAAHFGMVYGATRPNMQQLPGGLTKKNLNVVKGEGLANVNYKEMETRMMVMHSPLGKLGMK